MCAEQQNTACAACSSQYYSVRARAATSSSSSCPSGAPGHVDLEPHSDQLQPVEINVIGFAIATARHVWSKD